MDDVLTAKEWGWSPTAVIRQADDPHEHHPTDYNFAKAVATLLSEKCPRCGVPIWWAFSNNSDIAFKLKTIKCEGCVYKADEAPEKQNPGEDYIVYAVPDADDGELPPRRDYFEREMKKHAAEHEKEMQRKAKQEE